MDDPSERRSQENLRQLGGRVNGLDFVSALAELDNGGIEKLDEMLTVRAQNLKHARELERGQGHYGFYRTWLRY